MTQHAPTPALSSAPTLLQVHDLWREFPAGDGVIAVLKNINLRIHAGEMVAIVGQSGSGKSTLMNILGCLDKPSRGSYQVAGRETGQLEPDELAQLRREYFGFIFQRYHLLSDLSAQDNVEVPAVYAGTPSEAREKRSQALLSRLGLAARLDHTPSKLSGGQQQRVSIARALMNGGHVILADEPTGALDSASGVEVMKILGELHAEGHTIILVTHDMKVAHHANRIIELHDGEITSDRRNTPSPAGAAQSAAQAAPIDPVTTTAADETDAPDAAGFPHPAQVPQLPALAHSSDTLRARLGRLGESFRMALLAMAAHKLRTFLTMLGIIIGIASVVSVVALGEGSSQKILKSISSIGTNTIDIRPGTGFGDRAAPRIRTLVASDVDALAQQSYVDSVTPTVTTNLTIRFDNIEASGQVQGVGEQFFQVRGMELASGTLFDREAVENRRQVAVIDDNTRKTFFADGSVNPVGQVLFLGSIPVQIIGVLSAQEVAFGPSRDSPTVYVPYTTAMSRISGQNYVSSITVRVSDNASSQAAESGITQLLRQRHGRQDFFLINSDTIRQTIETTTQTMTLLISSIAVISLLVGGIGVMNIMLVSVTERTGEIGVRMAVGARQADIQMQFLIEAVLVCVLGGVLGISLALGFGALFAQLNSDFALAFSASAMFYAVACSSCIGIVFGYLPARSAARLNPIEALSRD